MSGLASGLPGTTAGWPRAPPRSRVARSVTWKPPLGLGPLWHATQERSSKGWISRENSTRGAVLPLAAATAGVAVALSASATLAGGLCAGSSDVASAITAQLEPAAE